MKTKKVTEITGVHGTDLYDLSRDGITQSILGNFVQCRQLCALKLACYEFSGYKESILFGNLGHFIMEEMYTQVSKGVLDKIPANKILKGKARKKSSTVEKKLKKANSLLAVALTKAEGKYRNKHSGEEYQTNLILFLDQLDSLFRVYIPRYKKDFLKTKWIGLETQFNVKFFGFRLKGKRDGLAQVGKGLWLLENKSMSQIAGNLLDTLGFDFQNSVYLIATEIELAKELDGMIYNIIRKPNIKQNQKETYEEYFERLEAEIRKKPSHYFQRFELRYPRPVIDNLRDELKDKLIEFKMWREGKLGTFKNQRACKAKWNCEFIPACASNSLNGYIINPDGPMRELKE